MTVCVSFQINLEIIIIKLKKKYDDDDDENDRDTSACRWASVQASLLADPLPPGDHGRPCIVIVIAIIIITNNTIIIQIYIFPLWSAHKS